MTGRLGGPSEKDVGRLGGSLTFDRAAEYYDGTRSLSDEIERSVGALAEELAGRGACLEIGVGTGRMALPLHERGFDLVGLDLSMPMMVQLCAKSGGTVPFPLVQADATSMCFASDTFDAAYAIWVLHLISGWRTVLDETMRVLRPNGALVIAFGGAFGTGPWAEISGRFRAVAEVSNLGASGVEEIDVAMRDRGCEVHVLEDLRTHHEVTPAEILRRLEEGTYSFTWMVDDATRVQAAGAVREWALERYGDLDTPLDNEFGAAWRRYEIPG